MHDILRFIHEKSVSELIEGAGSGIRSGAVRLDLPVPAGIMLIDIGGGLANQDGQEHVGPEQVTSIPFKSLITGMTHPGVWRSDAVPLTAHDFMTSMLRMPDITTDSAGHVGSNIAVISREYMNLSIKFGYHFTVVDCYCSPRARNNHVYFRFAGGATDITKRSRRLQVIERVLGQFGFNMKTRGDLIIARLANIRQKDLVNILDQLGRLIAYTRQLDAMLQDDGFVELYTENFMQGDYEFKGKK
jgi:pyruvate,water dikinase